MRTSYIIILCSCNDVLRINYQTVIKSVKKTKKKNNKTAIAENKKSE